MQASVKGNPKPAPKKKAAKKKWHGWNKELENLPKQVSEDASKIQMAVYDGQRQIQVEHNSLETATVEYLKKYQYKIRDDGKSTIVYW